jgi:hypothetical protein
MKLSKFLFDHKNEFVTEAAIKEGAALQAQINLISDQLRAPKLASDQELEAAEREYKVSPTAENLDRVLEARKVAADARPRIQAADLIHGARDRFFAKRILPWAVVVLKAGVASVKTSLEKIRAEESARVLEFTGNPITHSDIVEEVVRALRQLENPLVGVEKMTKRNRGFEEGLSPQFILRIFGFGPEFKVLVRQETALLKKQAQRSTEIAA